MADHMELAGQTALTQLQYYDARMRACDISQEDIRSLDHYRCAEYWHHSRQFLLYFKYLNGTRARSLPSYRGSARGLDNKASMTAQTR